MYRPTSVVADTDGTDAVYVAEQFNHRISRWRYTAGMYDFRIDAGQATSLNIDNTGSGYVSPTLEFSAPDLDIADPVTATGTIGQNSGNLENAVLTDGGNGYSVAPTVTVVDTTGTAGAVSVNAFNAPWGTNGDGTTGNAGPIGDGGPTDTSLYRPTALVFRNENRLFVTDTFHHRIRSINTTNGDFIASASQAGGNDDELYRPWGLVFNGGIEIVVADELNHRVVRYEIGTMPVSGTMSFTDILPDPSLSDDLSFVRPHGLVQDATSGTVRTDVGDSLRSIISQYNGNAYVQQFGVPGTGNSTELFYPASGNGDIELTSDDYIFADTRNNDLKYIANSDEISSLNAVKGTGEGQMYWPEQVISFGNTAPYVLVANTYNNRIEVFSNSGKTLSFESSFGSPT